MNKDVKKIISETFEELYQELISEVANSEGFTPEELAKAEEMINQAKKRGGNINYNNSQYTDPRMGLTDHNSKTHRLFVYVIDRLIDDYKISGDQNIKAAIQVAFMPTEGSRTLNTVVKDGRWMDKGEELFDAANSAYEQSIINNFDGAIGAYKTGSGGFGGLVVGNLKGLMNTYFTKGFRGKGLGGSQKDVFGGGYSQSMETPVGHDITLGSRLAGEADPTFDTGYGGREGEVAKKNEILNVINGWLENNVSTPQYTAFRELTKGKSPNEIAEEFPEIFENNKAVSRNFKQLVAGKGQEVSDLISHAFDIDFNMADIIPKQLKQTTAMDPAALVPVGAAGGKKTKISTPEIKAAKAELNGLISDLESNVLTALGIRDANDFNSQVKINAIVERLRAMDMNMDADEISNAQEDLKNAEAASSEFGKKVHYTDVEDSDEFGGVFEGFNMNSLMERVMKRISK